MPSTARSPRLVGATLAIVVLQALMLIGSNTAFFTQDGSTSLTESDAQKGLLFGGASALLGGAIALAAFRVCRGGWLDHPASRPRTYAAWLLLLGTCGPAATLANGVMVKRLPELSRIGVLAAGSIPNAPVRAPKIPERPTYLP